MSLQPTIDCVQSELREVEQLILKGAQTNLERLTQVMLHTLGSGGKRLRPVLLLLSSKLFGKSETPEQAIQAAQAIEYLHTATLLHDDVVDGAEVRRSQQAARKVWGNGASVSAGDFLLSQAFSKLTQLRHLEILRTISHTTTLMAKGEILQLARGNESPKDQDYLDIIIHKTASLFAAATKIGAILGGASQAQQEALYEYGKSLGIAFQIVDDTLDYSEEMQTVGKSVGTDLKERKITLPLSTLMKMASPQEQQRIQEILESKSISNADVHYVVQCMKKHGALTHSLNIATQYVERSRQMLDDLDSSIYKDRLIETSEFIVKRHF